MIENIVEIKYQACNICEAMLRNINDNFKSISFDILKNGDIQLKIILEEKGEDEDLYIDDMLGEFSSMQQSDCVKIPIIEIGYNHSVLNNVVYQSK